MRSDQLRQAANDLLDENFIRLSLPLQGAERLSEVFDAAYSFFQGEKVEKEDDKLPEDLGYRPTGIEYSQSAEHPDHIESFSVSARTPSACALSLSPSARMLHNRMMKAIDVLEPIAEALVVGLAETVAGRSFADKLSGTTHRWSSLQVNYSRLSELQESLVQELHEDGTLLTIACATGPGLEIRTVDGGEKQGHFGGVEIGQGVGYASAFSKPEKRPGRPAAFYFGSFFAASASAAC